ncbi:MAG: hypothetical protein A2W93_15105 [Bacteroidetes bacterium GWF2_43_63]|nr:MAG: hypothetical protein A2W94_04125 [Bacteroidetes bacterium GWE2_42_42]OFY54076.1 MAG: hypothetical protein A2W93_15105 [Bacteroidetes bacterium GWF2_43_63]HBG69717.1 hypothetical protein [Bacteroidales bacterium]HCB61093.1 hypothetical protein [Bacteroidales bacterium]HCY23393.1 hypothetical protein [Bacteroidales bacterium]
MRSIVIIGFFLLLMTSSSCLRVTFTGASIHPDAKTFSVQYFENNATLINPTLAKTMTEKLQDKIMGQTRLSMVNQNGDLAFEGEITSYTLQPVAIQGNETAQLTQLTVNINVRFFNRLDDSKNFEARFSRFQQFSSSSSLASVEDGLIETIAEELVDDIFNKALVNW